MNVTMIVLGEKYKFTAFELENLRKKFESITMIKYKNIPSEDIIKELEVNIFTKNHKVIVLNTKAKVSNEIIKYLINLQFERKKRDTKVLSINHFVEEYLNKCYIPETLDDLHFLDDIKPYSKWQYIQKRVIDFFGVFWLFFFSWPVMLICKKRIKEQSKGEILFKQIRVGKDKKLFECKKFRTMHENTHFDPYTRENDNRIFPFGEVMRKTRFDELPQMINILKGDMHLIGPRAEWHILVEDYEKKIPYYNERHLVKPGITGWAQVNYPYGQNIEDTRQKLMYDLYYIKHWNIGLELKIVWMTAMTVMNKRGL